MAHRLFAKRAQPADVVSLAAGARPRTVRLAGALGYPSFRWFALAQFISFTLLIMQMMVRGWQMQELTGSPFMVSLVGAMQVLPMLVFGFFGGELADRFPRKWVLIAGEAGTLAGLLAWQSRPIWTLSSPGTYSPRLRYSA